jgi:hypothetical protein
LGRSELYELTPDGQLRVRLHRGQTEAYKARERFIAVIAGTQSGKTSFGPYWLLREIQLRGPGDYLIAAPTYPLLSLKLVPEFKRLFSGFLNLGTFRDNPVPKFTFSYAGMQRLWPGVSRDKECIVHFGHALNPESLESMTALAAWVDEPGQKQFKLASWEAILRRLSLAQGRVLLTSTPYAVNSWLKKQIFDKAGDPRESIRVVSFRSTDNPVFPKEEYERARRNMPNWRFQMMYNGVFTRPAGLIYDSFKPEIHVIPPRPISHLWPRYAGLDFGAVNTVALMYAEEPGTGDLYLYREYKAANRTAKEHAEAISYDEPGFALVYGGAKSEDQWRDEFSAIGFPIRLPKVNDVELGIDRVYSVHRRNGIYVMSHCTGYLEQKESYSREVDENGEPTEAIADKNAYHFMDAERYLIPSIRSDSLGTEYVATVPDTSPGYVGYA